MYQDSSETVLARGAGLPQPCSRARVPCDAHVVSGLFDFGGTELAYVQLLDG